MRIKFTPQHQRTFRKIGEVTQAEIEGEVNLRQASLLNAHRHGGMVTRSALNCLELVGDRKHVIVDTKVTFLLPGMYPAIPGWHTDGVPRLTGLAGTYDPAGRGAPSIKAQVDEAISAPHYHLLLAGEGPHTFFLDDAVTLNLSDEDPALYREMSEQVRELSEKGFLAVDRAPEREWLTWSWWDIHAAPPATTAGWRYLIRVTESDHIPPREDPKDYLRKQSMVYVPTEFGW